MLAFMLFLIVSFEPHVPCGAFKGCSGGDTQYGPHLDSNQVIT